MSLRVVHLIETDLTIGGADATWVTTGEIQFNTVTDTFKKVTAAVLRNSAAKVFPTGTLLMAMYGQGKTRGQVAKLSIEAAPNQASAANRPQYKHDGASRRIRGCASWPTTLTCTRAFSVWPPPCSGSGGAPRVSPRALTVESRQAASSYTDTAMGCVQPGKRLCGGPPPASNQERPP